MRGRWLWAAVAGSMCTLLSLLYYLQGRMAISTDLQHKYLVSENFEALEGHAIQRTILSRSQPQANQVSSAIKPTKQESYQTSQTIDAPPNKDPTPPVTNHQPSNNQQNPAININQGVDQVPPNVGMPPQNLIKNASSRYPWHVPDSDPLLGRGFNEQEALNHLRKELEIERKEVDKWKKDQQQDIAEERRKIQEAQHGLLEEKIRFQKEMGEMMEEMRNGVLRGNMVGQHGGVIPQQAVPVAPVDPAQWLGLNHTTVHAKYPHILLHPQYALKSFFAPDDPLAAGMQGNPKSLNDLTAGQAEERFYQLVSDTHMTCNAIERLGNLGDGGWDICTAEPYSLKPGCIVYSFGINFDFSFDDSLATKYGCEVRAFDPSMNTGDHVHAKQVYFYQLGLGASNTVNSQGWRLQTMGSIMKKLQHTQTPIDIVKLDIEHNEWDCFHTMLKEGVLRQVKQLIFEMHTPEVYSVRRPSTKEDFIRMAAILRGLEEQGFRRYHFHYNPFGLYTSIRTGKSRTCCYELYYLNVNYLR